MKFIKDGIQLFIFTIVVILSSKAACINSKFNSDQILEKKDHEVQIFKNSYITPKNVKVFSTSTNLQKVKIRIGDTTTPEKNETCYLQFLEKILITYLQFFVLFSILSFYKFFEELNQIKQVHIAGKYNDVKDLTSEKYKYKISELNGENVFISGETNINSSATDEFLQLNIDKQYAMIYRTVEIFNSNTDTWVPLIEDGSDKNLLNDEVPQINLLNEYFMDVSYCGKNMKFPKLFSKAFCGEVKIY